MKRINILLLLLTATVAVQAQRMDLSGEWRFAIDRQDVGVSQQWYSSPLSDVVTLPGSMMTNHQGDDIDVNTEWTGDIVDRSYYDSPDYAKYTGMVISSIHFGSSPTNTMWGLHGINGR